MENRSGKHIFTKAGDPVIHTSHRSYIFEKNAAEALIELNQVILHMNRLIEQCPGLADMDIEGFYDINLMDTLCRFQELRDGEFGDYVNWNTIAKAIKSSQ